MLCKVQHLWTSGASFTLNCYHHHTQMLVRTPSRTFKTILDSKGFTRGGGGWPWLPVVQTSTTLSTTSRRRSNMSTSSGARMTLLAAEDSPSSGIILLPSVSPEDTSLNPPSPSWRQVRPASGRSREYFSGLNFKIISVNQYLGAWVWELEGGGAWIQVRVESWVNSNHHLDNVAAACHQTAYTGFQQTLQQECQFMKYTTG